MQVPLQSILCSRLQHHLHEVAHGGVSNSDAISLSRIRFRTQWRRALETMTGYSIFSASGGVGVNREVRTSVTSEQTHKDESAQLFLIVLCQRYPAPTQSSRSDDGVTRVEVRAQRLHNNTKRDEIEFCVKLVVAIGRQSQQYGDVAGGGPDSFDGGVTIDV